jgi:hypothetical protein
MSHIDNADIRGNGLVVLSCDVRNKLALSIGRIILWNLETEPKVKGWKTGKEDDVHHAFTSTWGWNHQLARLSQNAGNDETEARLL